MKIQEAIKCGRKIKREKPSFGPYFGEIIQCNERDQIRFSYLIHRGLGDSGMPLTIEDILADDWIYEPRDPLAIYCLVDKKEPFVKAFNFGQKEEAEHSNARDYGGQFVVRRFIEVIE